MVTIKVCTSEDPCYEAVCNFAKAGYLERYNIALLKYPDVFVYAEASHIIGCFGAYRGSQHNPLTTEWYIPPVAIQGVVKNGTRLSREHLYEIGTRVVKLPPGASTNSIRLSVGMTAALLPYILKQGGLYTLFTADRSVEIIARQLHVELTRFGPPDLSRQTDAYLHHWQAYFAIPRECFGFNLAQAVLGCKKMCANLLDTGFAFDPVLFTPEPEFEVAV